MPLRLAADLPARIVLVLIDFLPDELDLLDTDMNDGYTTPDIANDRFYEWDRQILQSLPGMTMETVNTRPIEVKTDGHGRRVHSESRVLLKFHVAYDTTNELNIDRQLRRYVTGAIRVLAIMKERLHTIADPADYVEVVKWVEPASYGPLAEQAGGVVVRTGTVPLMIKRTEAR